MEMKHKEDTVFPHGNRIRKAGRALKDNTHNEVTSAAVEDDFLVCAASDLQAEWIFLQGYIVIQGGGCNEGSTWIKSQHLRNYIPPPHPRRRRKGVRCPPHNDVLFISSYPSRQQHLHSIPFIHICAHKKTVLAPMHLKSFMLHASCCTIKKGCTISTSAYLPIVSAAGQRCGHAHTTVHGTLQTGPRKADPAGETTQYHTTEEHKGKATK